jgi:hypothetical protein
LLLLQAHSAPIKLSLAAAICVFNLTRLSDIIFFAKNSTSLIKLPICMSIGENLHPVRLSTDLKQPEGGTDFAP